MNRKTGAAVCAKGRMKKKRRKKTICENKTSGELLPKRENRNKEHVTSNQIYTTRSVIEAKLSEKSRYTCVYYRRTITTNRRKRTTKGEFLQPWDLRCEFCSWSLISGPEHKREPKGSRDEHSIKQAPKHTGAGGAVKPQMSCH